jgi:leucine dehydrogenase
VSVELEFDHERVEIVTDSLTGFIAVLAVHSTALGPAMGGLRLRSYPGVAAALADSLRLSRVMSLKNALAGLELGGGKMVLVDDGGWSDGAERAERMRAVGRMIEALDGAYITAEDVGTTPEDMEEIATTTNWVAGRPIDSGGRGDPSPSTALTVFGAIRAAASERLGSEEIDGLLVGVQGVGHVGSRLVELLRGAGAEVIVADAVADRADELADRTGARVATSSALVGSAVDVFAPCAFGEVISQSNVASLHCAVVAGAANNPLSDLSVAETLDRRGILYVPDFVANCGGIIHVGAEPLGLTTTRVDELIADAVSRTGQILREANANGRLPLTVALELAERRLAAARARHRIEPAEARA